MRISDWSSDVCSSDLDQLGAGDAGGAGAVDHDLDLGEVTPGQRQGVDEAGGGDDGGAVLVVVEHRNVHQLLQALLDDEALRRLDVFQVHAATRLAEEAPAVHSSAERRGGKECASKCRPRWSTSH